MGLVFNDDHSDYARSTKGRKLYSCDAPDCDVRRVPWTKDWRWYGTIRDMEDDPAKVITLCSDKCQKAFDDYTAPKIITPRND